MTKLDETVNGRVESTTEQSTLDNSTNINKNSVYSGDGRLVGMLFNCFELEIER